MNHTAPILLQLDEFMKHENINLSTLAKRAQVNVGTLSAILNGNKMLTVDHLDRLSSVMDLPEGYFYERYVQEYLSQSIPNWRRFRPFLYRCADLDKLECIKQATSLLMENLMYSPLLFEVAEDLFQKDKRAAAALLFENVANSEKQQHSERLAFCHYRLFLMRLGTDQEKNYQAAIQFEPYVERLDELDQLDALRELINTYQSLRRWDKVYTTAVKLNKLAKIQYSLADCVKEDKNISYKKLIRPLFFYVTFSQLLIGASYYEQENYELALQIAYDSIDLDWVKETDEETLRWKSLFQVWFQANIYLTNLMAGNIDKLSDYVTFIESKEDEILPGLWNIMIAANRFKLDVDHILLKFQAYIIDLQEPKGNDIITQPNTDTNLVGFLYELAIYYLFKGKHEKGFRCLLDSLRKVILINDESSMLKCMRLFEHFREFASFEEKFEYHNLVKVGDIHEEKTSLSTRS